MREVARQAEVRLWTVEEIIERLGVAYGPARAPRSYEPIAELVYTILSQHTADINSVPAYRRLIETFGTWESIAGAPGGDVIQAVRQGGLAQVKGPRIQAILREVHERVGSFDLTFLSRMPLEEAKAWLRSMPGVGPKTAACVLLFALGMPALPVDTHIYRVARRLGLIDPTITPDRAHEVLEGMLASGQVLPFHMYLIIHGRRVCRALRPMCERCVIEERCPSSLLKPGTPAVGFVRRKKAVSVTRENKSKKTARARAA